MMNETQLSEAAKRSEIAKMILDDDWLPVEQSDLEELNQEEEISFKPITDGLGFMDHKEILPVKKSTQKSNSFQYIDRPVRDKEMILAGMSQRAVTEVESKNSHLAAFYQDSKAPEQTIKSKKKKRKVKKASLEARVVAWGLDVLIITTMLLGFSAFLTSIFNISFISMINMGNTVFLASAWSLFYVIYFTILDLDRTFGKSLLKLKTVKSRGHISIVDTFVRTVVSLVSLGCFFIPTLFDLHGHLSDTKVIKWK